MKLKFRSKGFLKKSAAIGVAALLGVTAAPVSAFAEGTYNDIVKNAWTESISAFAAEYARSFEEYDMLQSGVHEDLTLTLDDAGRSLLGFLVPADISWFKDLNLASDVTLAEEGEFMNAGLYLNGTKLCSMEYYFDFETMDIYMRFPELHDGYLKMNYADSIAQSQAQLEEQIQAMEDAGSTAEEIEEFAKVSEQLTSGITSPEFFKAMMQVTGDLPAFLPETAVVEELLNKYGSIIFDHIEPGENTEENVTLNQISANCKVYEGRLTSGTTKAMMQEILNTAKADEQLKNILNSWDEKLEQTENLYQSFLDALEKGLTEVEAMDTDNGASYFSSKIYADENDKIVGEEISMVDGEETTPLFRCMTLSDGTGFESDYVFGPAEEGIALNGNGSIKGSLLSGTYTLDVEGTPVAKIEVQDYDINAPKNGCFSGSYEFTPIITTEAGENYNMLQNFALIADIASERESGSFVLTLASAGASLGKLSVTANLGATVEKPDPADFAEVYDLTDETALSDYSSGMAFETILENLSAAGVPNDLIEAILSNATGKEIHDDSAVPVEEIPDSADAA